MTLEDGVRRVVTMRSESQAAAQCARFRVGSHVSGLLYARLLLERGLGSDERVCGWDETLS